MRTYNMFVALIKLGRLHFLLGGVVFHSLGVLMAVFDGAQIDVALFIGSQIVITATQLAVQYSNEYFDLDADRHNLTPTRWSGGSRILVDNRLPHRVALWIALGFGSIALAGSIILSLTRHDFVLFLILITAQSMAWFYSAPPLRLHSRGVGEIVTAVIIPILTPLTGYYVQAGHINLLSLLSLIPLFFVQIAMLLSIEFPDADGDRLADKHTLVVRLGAETASNLTIGCILGAYLSLPMLWLAGTPFLVIAGVLLTLPLALIQLWRMWRGDWANPQQWNALGFYSIVLLGLIALSEIGAYLLLVGL